MKDLKEFYKKYNLNHEYCGKVIGVGTRSLIKYAKGEKLREDAKKRIEFGIDVIERYNLVRPHFPGGFDVHKKGVFTSDNFKYMRETRELIERERALL